MKFTWIYILYCALAAASCGPISEKSSPKKSELDVEEKTEEAVRQETLEDLVDLGNEETDLPILPPIILIDFTNGTNLTSEEKSKRTINGNLGYGFQGNNNLFSGKYNYYFPAGKTGTTVSIEESISPFLPTTIIEKVNPHSQAEKYYSNSNVNSYPNSGGQSNTYYGSHSNGHPQSQIGGNVSPLVFGQRTKLQKSNGDNFQSFARFTPTQKPNYAVYSTPKPRFQSNEFTSAPSLGSYNNPGSIYEGFSTARPPLYNAPLQGQYNSQSVSNFNTYNPPHQRYEGVSTTISPPAYNSLPSGSSLGNYGKQGVGLQSYTTPKPQAYNPSQSQTTVLSPLGNSPKYSYEDGVRYEHKIVWKYPNGMVSDVAPNSYDTTYSEYSTPTKVSLTSNFQNPAGPVANFPKTLNSGYSVNAGSIYSQKPATFPDNGAASNEDSKPNQFVSSSSISNGREYYSTPAAVQPTPPSQKYSFQSQYPVNSNGQLAKTQASTSPSPASYNANFEKANLEESQIASNYPVDSPDPEYPPLDRFPSAEAYERPDAGQPSPYNAYSQNSYGQSSGPSSDPTSSGKTQSPALSKYTPQVQQYLKKALGLGESGQSQGYGQQSSSTPESYSNLQYSNLLDYNPSISQYVRDPSSILNAQPTFVQAGNSLIPVIILRVDGVAPIQSKVAPNINLKALLQKYLSQYAQTVNDLSQGKNNFDRGYGPSASGSGSPPSSKLFELDQLTQSLSQFGSRSNFKQNFAQNFAQSVAQDYQPGSFSSIDNNDAKYLSPGTRETLRKPKVKNVQIVDDPRFTNYKVKN